MKQINTAPTSLRKTGLKILGNLPWGTHFCQFYKTKQDLLDVLIPFFRSGLENNELCVWVTSDFLDENDARRAMAAAIPNFDNYLGKGQIEIFPHTQWYLKEGRFEMRRVMNKWIRKHDRSLKDGYDGCRVSGNPFWINNQKDWNDFSEYESEINNVIGSYKLLVLCTYSLDKCGASEIIDVVNNHQFALIKKDNRLTVLKNSVNKKINDAVCKNNLQYQSLFRAMTESFALRELVFDPKGKAVDCLFREVNFAFENFIGLPRNKIIGKLRREIPVSFNDSSFKIYVKTALTGKPARFETYNEDLKKHFSVYVYRPATNQFATIFTDITDRKKAEEALKKAEERSRLIIAKAPAMIYEIDIKGTKFISVNDTMCLMLGYTRKELMAMKPTDLIDEESRKLFAERIKHKLAGNKLPDSVEYRGMTKSGRKIYLSVKTTFVHKNGRPETAVVVAYDITERKLMEEKLRESEEKYRGVFENNGEMMAIYKVNRDRNGRITERILKDGNQAMVKDAGFKSIKEIYGKTTNEIYGNSYSNNNARVIEKIMASKKIGTFEATDKERDKHYFTTVTPLDKNHYIASIKDISEIKKTEKRLTRLNQTLKALSAINHAIIRAKNEKQFLEEVCQIIIRDCGHKMVWVGFTSNDKEKIVIPEASAGFERGYLKTLKITWTDTERGRGPSGTAIRTGKPAICHNMTADPFFAPWRDEAIKRGYASSIALPLASDGKTFGVLTIYSKDLDPFLEDEIKLLEQLANDLSYGITTLRLRQANILAKEKLRQTSEYLDNLLRYANTPIIVWNPELKITHFNNAFEVLTGYHWQSVIGKKLDFLFPKADRKIILKYIYSALRGKRWETIEIPILCKDGAIRNLLWNSATIFGSDRATAVATIAQGQDITNQKIAEAQRQLAQTELKQHAAKLEKAVQDLQTLHLAVENAPDIIFIADPEGNILSVNKSVKHLLGYSPKEVIGKKIDFSWQTNGAKNCEKILAAVKSEKKNFMGEIVNLRKSGEKMIFDLHISPVLDKKHNVLFFIGVERDQTEAKEVDRAKTEFISLAAHQLRTPLSTMSMAAEMLMNGNIGQIDQEAKDQIKNICNTAHQMAGLIELFLNISRIELGRLEINPEPTNIAILGRDLIKEILPQAGTKKITVKTDFKDGLPNINIDRKVMQIVLENLLTNAIKYSPRGEKIQFSIYKTGNEIACSVADNGCGIPKSQIPLIFTKMFRAENVGDVKGLGLGLNMAKSAIEQCGGSITFKSEENKGSTFTVFIPLSGMKKKKIKMAG